jgi:hypothetical protein
MINEIESAEADRFEAEEDALCEKAEALREEVAEILLRAQKLGEQARELRHGPLVDVSVLSTRHRLGAGVLRDAVRSGAVRGFKQRRGFLAFERDVARWVREGCPTDREAFAEAEEVEA